MLNNIVLFHHNGPLIYINISSLTFTMMWTYFATLTSIEINVNTLHTWIILN